MSIPNSPSEAYLTQNGSKQRLTRCGHSKVVVHGVWFLFPMACPYLGVIDCTPLKLVRRETLIVSRVVQWQKVIPICMGQTVFIFSL